MNIRKKLLLLNFTVGNGCNCVQRIRDILGNENVEVPEDETLSLAKHVEHSHIQVCPEVCVVICVDGNKSILQTVLTDASNKVRR